MQKLNIVCSIYTLLIYKNIYDSDRLYVYITLRPLTFEQ